MVEKSKIKVLKYNDNRRKVEQSRMIIECHGRRMKEQSTNGLCPQSYLVYNAPCI